MNIAAYVRFSSDNQREESITAQLRAIQAYAQAHGHTLVATYSDEAKSATTANRPQFLQMIDDAQTGAFQAVVVHKLDRFSRNRYDAALYKKMLKDVGVALYSVLENLDDSPESIILESVLQGLAEYYSANLSREVMKGLKENALSCRHTGGLPPYGYVVQADKTYVIDPQAAAVVRFIFESAANGMASGAICRALTEKGIRTRSGRPFTKSALTAIIPNEKYIGIYTYGKKQRKRVNGRYVDVDHPADQVIRIEGGIPAIVSQEIFKKANQSFQIRKKGPSTASTTANRLYLLSGLLYCGECGSRMIGEHANARPGRAERSIYRCRGEREGRCSLKAIRKDLLEQIVCDALAECFTPAFLDLVAEKVMAKIQESAKKADNTTHELKNRLAAVNAKAAKTVEVMLTMDPVPKSVTDALTALDQERISLEKQLAEEASRSRLLHKPDVKAVSSILNLSFSVNAKSPEEQMRILRTFCEKIVVFSDHVEIWLDSTFLNGADPYPFKVLSIYTRTRSQLVFSSRRIIIS